DPALGLVDVPLGRNDIEISRQYDGRCAADELGGVPGETLEPAQLVVESRTGCRVAVRQVEATDGDLPDLRFDVAAMGILGIAGEHAADLGELVPTGEYRNAVPALLAVPDHSVTGGADGELRKFLLRGFQFLQANDIGRALIEPAQKIRQPCADAV